LKPGFSTKKPKMILGKSPFEDKPYRRVVAGRGYLENQREKRRTHV